MRRDWSPEEREEVLRLVESGIDHAIVGRKFRVSKSAISGIVYRFRSPEQIRERAVRERVGKRTKAVSHQPTQLEPSKTPFASDHTCPDFAWDEEHIQAVLAANGEGFIDIYERARRILRGLA